MKKMNSFIIISIIIVVLSCSQNKSVIEQLKVNEISKLIAKDSLYEDVINEIEIIRIKFKDDLVLQSKFIDLTYYDYLIYNKALKDTSHLYKVVRKARKDYTDYSDSLMIKYKPIIEKKLDIYKKMKQENDPSSFCKVEFIGIEKIYSSVAWETNILNILYKITPLKGAIQHVNFMCDITLKKLNFYEYTGYESFSIDISKPLIIKRDASIVWKKWKNKTSKEIRETCNFKFTIMSVTSNNKEYSFLHTEIPLCYRYNLDPDSLSKSEYEYIISEQYKVEIMQIEDFLLKVNSEEKMKLNKLAYDLEILIDNF